MTAPELFAYFTAEKQGAVLIACMGLAASTLATYLWLTGSPFRAMAWPLVVIGVGQLAIGVVLLVRTDPQVARLQEGLQSNPQVTVQSELTRMARVNRSFKVIEVLEVLFLLAGLALTFGLRSRHPAWAAVGMGLFLQATATLVFDLFAEHRALVYTRWLTELSHKLAGVCQFVTASVVSHTSDPSNRSAQA